MSDAPEKGEVRAYEDRVLLCPVRCNKCGNLTPACYRYEGRCPDCVVAEVRANADAVQREFERLKAAAAAKDDPRRAYVLERLAVLGERFISEYVERGEFARNALLVPRRRTLDDPEFRWAFNLFWGGNTFQGFGEHVGALAEEVTTEDLIRKGSL